MAIALSVLVVIHVSFGALALLSGLVAMLSGKGNARHRLAGQIYVASMAGVFVTASIVASIRFNPFLLLVGVFSFSATVSGYRVVFHKRPDPSRPAAMLDRILLGVSMLCSLVMIAFGVYLVLRGSAMGWVSIVFAAVLLSGSTRLWRHHRWQMVDAKRWMRLHVLDMGTSYIAAVTALLVNNARWFPLPGAVLWLLPTLIGAPLLIRASRRYRAKQTLPA